MQKVLIRPVSKRRHFDSNKLVKILQGVLYYGRENKMMTISRDINN